MGMKLLLDECLHSNREFHETEQFERVVDVLGRGTKDIEILKYIKGTNLLIVTRVWGLILECIKQGNDAVFRNVTRKENILIKREEFPVKFSDPLTYYLSENEEMIMVP